MDGYIMKRVWVFLGRFFLSLIFLTAAIQKGIDWHRTESEVVQALSRWHTHFSEGAFFKETATWAPFLLVIAIFLEFVGALLVLLNIRMKLGAFFLVIFFIPTTLLFYPFWFFEGAERDEQIVMFLKNLAILGGLFLLLGKEAFKNKTGISNGESSDLPGND